MSKPNTGDREESHSTPTINEHNYMGSSDCSSVDSSNISISITYPQSDVKLHLKATELRLGLPGSQSPERDIDPDLSTFKGFDEKFLFPLHSSMECTYLQNSAVSGNKRGFSDAMDGPKEGVEFLENADLNGLLSHRLSPNMGLEKEIVVAPPSKMTEVAWSNTVEGRSHSMNEATPNINGKARATKAQVVGWPPVRSFRQKIMATTSKNSDEVEKKPVLGASFVKVSMDGAPYLRKVDLRNYSAYLDLSSALTRMFSCFTLGRHGSHGASGRVMLSESKLKDLVHGSEFVLTYEDKDGDWMLVGDVPWEMFTETCKRLRIMKSADAIGLAPRTPEKAGSVNR